MTGLRGLTSSLACKGLRSACGTLDFLAHGRRVIWLMLVLYALVYRILPQSICHESCVLAGSELEPIAGGDGGALRRSSFEIYGWSANRREGQCQNRVRFF